MRNTVALAEGVSVSISLFEFEQGFFEIVLLAGVEAQIVVEHGVTEDAAKCQPWW